LPYPLAEQVVDMAIAHLAEEENMEAATLQEDL